MREFISIVEGRDAPLYRAYREPQWAVKALRDDELVGSSAQRYWPDGKRRMDDAPDYRESFWMKGLSMTRDIDYAKQWGDVVMVFDQRLLSQRFKFEPFNWGYSIPGGNHHKREREEFLVLKKTGETFGDENWPHGKLDTKRFREPEGSIKPLSKYLIGFWLDQTLDHPEGYKHGLPEEDLTYLKSHPKFLGYFKNPRKRK